MHAVERQHSLSALLAHPGIQRRGRVTWPTRSSGQVELDALLPGGGWPLGGLSEILVEHEGLGEISLVLPVLAQISREQRKIAMIAPPHVPYAPALTAAGLDLDQLVHLDAAPKDRDWSAEQCLRAGCCAAVLHWAPKADYRILRRLQLAAETGAALGFVFRPVSAANQASPAMVRLLVSRETSGTCITMLKARNGAVRSQIRTRLAC